MRALGHDTSWIRTSAPGSADDEVLEMAQIQDRVLITSDKDFGELAFLRGLPAPSGVILFRARASGPDRLTSILVAAL